MRERARRNKGLDHPEAMKTPTIKGYIPVRIELPPIILGRSDDVDRQQHQRHYTFTSFIYVKEHAPNTSRTAAVAEDGDSTATTRRTLFIANCPANGPLPTDAYLRAIFESSFDADIVRVTVIQDHTRHRHNTSITAAGTATPNDVFFRQQQTSAAGLDDYDICAPSRRREGDGKFAHVVFATSNEMKRVMKKLAVVNISERPLRLEDAVLHRLLSVERTKDDDDNNDEGRLRGIHAVVARAHNKAGRRNMSRRDLMRLCNDVMTSYERDEEGMINEAKMAKDRPDEDGFVTVTYNKKKTSTSSSSVTMMTATSSIGLEEDGIGVGDGGGRRRGGGGRDMGDGPSSKRNRKRKSNNNIISGADELTDFYRYQMKHTRKVEVQELKKRFEEDLARVRKMKEERAYRPF
jgi:ribosomal RNA-processing protein 7